MAPFLFNVYLHVALNNNPTLKKLIDNNQLLCFADDMIVRVKTKNEATEAIKAIESLQTYDLMVNKKKSQILKGPTCLKDLEELEGIPIKPKVKYLGYTLSATRTQLFHDAQANIRKHMNIIKGKLRLQNPAVLKLVQAAYGRSLLTYFGTPLVASGVWDLSKISN